MGERNPYLVERLQGFGTTIFAEMSELASRTGAINLGQGFPDADGPDAVLEAAVAAMRAGHNQYPPSLGVPALRRAVADHQRRFYGLEVDPDTEVLVTAGASEAIAAAMLALVEPGDEVVVFEPYFDHYATSIALAGGRRRVVRLQEPDLHFDVADLEAAVGPNTRLILLNSPHNPAGKVFDANELAAVAAVAVEHDLLVVTDEVYEHLVFDDVRHIPMATLPGMAERTLTISSAGKSFGFTGWKVGWAMGSTDLVSAVVVAKQSLTYVSSGPFQHALVVALGLDDDEHRADRYHVALPTGDLEDLAVHGAFHRHGGLVGHHVDEFFVFTDRIADLLVPLHDLGLGDAFADIGHVEGEFGHFVQSFKILSSASPMRMGPGK